VAKAPMCTMCWSLSILFFSTTHNAQGTMHRAQCAMHSALNILASARHLFAERCGPGIPPKGGLAVECCKLSLPDDSRSAGCLVYPYLLTLKCRGGHIPSPPRRLRSGLAVLTFAVSTFRRTMLRSLMFNA